MLYATLILLGILAAVIIIYVVKLSCLSEKEEELSKFSVHLDERANMLAQWEQELLERPYKNDDYKVFNTVYCISESDLLKHETEASLNRLVKDRMAHTLAHDILRNFETEVSEDGMKHTLRIFVRQ